MAKRFLDDADVARLKRVVDAQGQNPSPEATQRTPALNDVWLKTTSGTASGGLYPATIVSFDGTGTEVSLGVTCWAKDVNAAALANATYYRGTLARFGGSPSYAVYLVDVTSAAASTITVEEVDGSPSYASIGTLRFDQADGFVVTQPGGGIARVDQTAASTTTVGYVNTTTQSFAGKKTFDGSSLTDEPVVTINGPGNPYECQWWQAAGTTVARLSYDGSFETSGTLRIGNAVSEAYRLSIGLVTFDGSECGYIGYNNAAVTTSTGCYFDPTDNRLILFSADTNDNDACYAVIDSASVIYTGAYATVSGLTFKGGLYTSGSLTLSNDSVTNSVLNNMAAWTYKIRNAGSTGDPSDAALADFTEETAPAGGDFLIGFLDSGEIRKFNANKWYLKLSAPAQDAILFHDVSLGSHDWLLPSGNGISISGTTLNVNYNNSITVSGGNLQLEGDASAPGNSYYYGTNSSGAKGFYSLASSGPATWVKVTKTYSDLSTGSTTNSITVYTLPARTLVLATAMNHTTAFSGGGLSTYSLDLGITGNDTRYLAAYSVTGAPGSSPNTFGITSMSGVQIFEDAYATVAVKLKATCDVNLSNATAGSVDIYLLIASAP